MSTTAFGSRWKRETMTSPRQVTLASFASPRCCQPLYQALRDQGYNANVLPGADWLAADRYRSEPIVLLLDGTDYPHADILRVLDESERAAVLVVFCCEELNWDEAILHRCTDFLGWPCHASELRSRLRRVFGTLEVRADMVDEIRLLEQFVGLNLLGRSPAFVRALKLIKRFARCDAPVLIEGETGTGKELVSRGIHYLSARRDHPFIAINCGAIPDNLVENELFGHVRGAFTDAKESQPGLVAQARGGTLFLDEVDTLSLKAQIALLRFLERQEYRPLGGKETNRADVRVITATNASLQALAEAGTFRQDLLFRLNVLAVRLPPLRERTGDIELLTEHFLDKYSVQYRQPIKSLHPDTWERMMRYRWPGNVRELENLLHREFLLTDGPVICVDEENVGTPQTASRVEHKTLLSAGVSFQEAKANTVEAFERSYLHWLMAEARGNVSLAARRAKKERSALRRLLKKHGIEKGTWTAGH
jgi:DNA-binding NtrC family response regulator